MSSPTEVPFTPAILIDMPTVHRNINKLAAWSHKHRIGVRPHTKTHKSIAMARLQLQAGAVGLAVAKAGEAETMAEACDDILVAYPAFDPYRREHLTQLAKHKTVRVGLDSQYAAEMIAAAAHAAGVRLGVLVDIDVGLHRTGVQSAEDALHLAQFISRTKGLRFDGLMCYPGHLKQPLDQQSESLQAVSAILSNTIDLLRHSGLEATIVSGGSTPTAYQSHLVPCLTEIRPGTYIYNDMNTVSAGHCDLAECAAMLVCTVISNAVPGKFVLDAGSKTLTQDRRSIDPDTAGFGHILEYPSAKITRLTEEHGEVDVSMCDKRPNLGDRVHVIPNHICPCINLQDSVWLRNEPGAPLEAMKIDARGKLA
jgi:D-serine deaminase-like pyridoxal phosphate-dependent protein